MLIYDSLAGTKKLFKPMIDNTVKLYVCGQTVYDYSHIGHARSMIVFDMVVRYFRLRGYQVTYVRNITDVDDKIIQRAQENKESSEALAQTFIDINHEDEQALNLLPVDYEPRATEYMPEIIQFIETLIDKNAAYVAKNGDVCFSVRSFKSYGKLSKRDIDKLIAGARVDIQQDKNDPLDFVLWKLAKPGEPQWDSPWGAGRPGWHIECSAMAETLLGHPFDIHGGGMDLKFPHHENEIAQSEAAHDKTFANTWMHVGLLTRCGEKMSKSLKNFVTIREALKTHSAEVIRYFMLAAHYRSPVQYSDNSLALAKQALTRLYTAIRDLPLSDVTLDHQNAWVQKFFKTMDDDFNSSEAMAVLFDMAHEINKFKEKHETSQATIIAAQLQQCAAIFGLLQESPESFLQGNIDVAFSEQVEDLIQQRNAARKNKDFEKADQLREALAAMQVVIEDGPEGTTWHR